MTKTKKQLTIAELTQGFAHIYGQVQKMTAQGTTSKGVRAILESIEHLQHKLLDAQPADYQRYMKALETVRGRCMGYLQGKRGEVAITGKPQISISPASVDADGNLTPSTMDITINAEVIGEITPDQIGELGSHAIEQAITAANIADQANEARAHVERGVIYGFSAIEHNLKNAGVPEGMKGFVRGAMLNSLQALPSSTQELMGKVADTQEALDKQRVQTKGGKTKADRDKARFERWQYLQAKYLLNGGNWSLSKQAQAEGIMERHQQEPSFLNGQDNNGQDNRYDVATVAKRLIPTKGKDQAQLRDKLQNILDASKDG